MMGISSSSESEDDDVDSFSSWESSSSSDISYKSAVVTRPTVEPVTSRAAEVKVKMESVTDLRVLFNNSILKSLASVSTKEDINLNVLQQHRSKIITWLTELNLPTSEGVITQEMFCDFLTNKGVNREDAIDVFSRFDTEGCGKADAELVQEGVTHLYEESENGELAYRTRILQGCPSLPGFVDVFSKTDTSSKHATKLLNFLIRNRASTSNFCLPMLSGLEDTVQLRSRVALKIMSRLQKEMRDSDENKLLYIDSTSEVRSTGKPYSSIEASSNEADVYKLTDGSTVTSWQSDGPARSHWIRLNMKKNVVVKQLFVHVASADQSYMPQEIVVSVGKKQRLRDIKDVRVPATTNGAVLLIENLKVYYPVVQIYLKRCHSDGCDARIHLLKVSGLKVAKEAEISVKDASMRWFFQLTASTALSCAQTLPAYRQLIINQTKEAFKHILPMSLCQGSSDRPKFLNQPILSEMYTFLENITRDDQPDVSDDTLLCKIMYGLAACDLASILSVISHLLDSTEKLIDTGNLLSSMQAVKARFWAKGEKLLPLTYVDCDGGEKQSESSGCIQPKEIINYDSTNYTDDAYTTKKGKTKFTMILEASECVQVTHIKIRPAKGGKGVQCGIVFLLPLTEVVSPKKASEDKVDPVHIRNKSSLSLDDQKALYKRLEKYDEWTEADYEAHVTKCQGEKEAANTDGVLCYFAAPDDPNDWDELEMPINVKMMGHIVVIKFLKPRSDSSDKIAVVGVNMFGYSRTSDYFLEVSEPTKSGPLRSPELCNAILSFLIVIIKSLENRHVAGTKLPYVDFSRLSVSLITELFHKVQSLGEVGLMRKVLLICHSIFLNWAPGKDEKDTSLLFDTFSSIINLPGDLDPTVVAVARSVIVDGAKAFFPNEQMRKEQLLRMLKDINRANELPSTGLVFESLCQFFSDVEPSALLNIPIPSDCIKSAETLQGINDSCFEIMDTLIYVTLHKALISSSQSSATAKTTESLSTLSSGVTHSVLVKLLSCLQTGFLVWINSMKSTENKDLIAKSEQLLLSYLKMEVEHFIQFTETFLELPDAQLSAIFASQEDFVFSTLQQLVVYLSEYCKNCTSADHNMEILKIMWPFVERMKMLRDRRPDHFPALESEHWSKVRTEVEVLNTWTEESPHNYHNNQNATKVFNCSGAKFFVVEFDSRCHTERKYDYLEFSNCSGITHKYDQKVGTESWPLRVEIKGNKLQFLFHSDQSNNEWGYKFTVTAKGIPETPINSLFDFHLSLALLLGHVCGQTIAMPPTVAKSPSLDIEADNELLMLKSKLWKTLFRAGYQPTDKLERSLSGRYMHGCYDEVKGYLLELLNDSTSEPFHTLLSHLQSKCKHYQKVGADEITSAILHTFAALIYHTTEICASVAEYIKTGHKEGLIDGVYQAYNLAEQLRLPLISLRQKTLEKGDSQDFTLAKEMIDKANLLLKFAALTKAPRFEKSMKTNKPRKASAKRLANHDLLKRLEGSIPEKYGQFHLVLEFIVEPSWNCQMVENTIHQRVKKSKSLCMTYQLIRDYLKSSPGNNIIQIDNVLFLRAVLRSQKSFPMHYADTIDGCGLEQESKLRMHFYALIRLLVNTVKSFAEKGQTKNIDTACSIIQTCLLHLLDMDWRENDFMFLKEIDLPAVFFTASKNNVAVRERFEHPTDEKEEMATYDKDKQYYLECHEAFSKWYSGNSNTNNKNQDVQMFIARHCDLLDVEIYCDGCGQTMPGKRYRCLQCIDLDLCVTCFTGGVTPAGEHKDDHTFVYFMYKCDICQAFISGERVHCKVCDDFDLCYGCYKKKKMQAGHDADHEVVRYPQTRLKSACNSNHMSVYIHQHSWLQFAQLTLAMAGTVFGQSEIRSMGSPGEEYTDTATHLLAQCLSLVMESLQKVSSFNNKVGQVVDYREEVFVQHSQERIMGLLGSIISLEEQYDAELNTMLTTTDFLKFIFYIGSGQGGYGQHSTVQHLALGLLAQLMQKSSISTRVTDEAVLSTQKRSLDELEHEESGLATIEFIVQAATSCLEKQQGMDWSCSLIRLLQQLVHTPHWSNIMKQYLMDSVTLLAQKMSLDLVLCLFIISGFPQVKSPGVSVKYLDASQEQRKAVILKHFPDKMQSMVIDSVTRKKKMIKDQLVEHSCMPVLFYNDHLLSLITNIIIENSAKLMKGTLLDMETHWILSLCLKAFDQFVTSHVPYENLDVIRSLVNLAGMGTRLSKLWLVTDLEILSLMLYIKLGNNPSASVPSDASAAGATPTGPPKKWSLDSFSEDAFDPFPDMDKDSKKHFMVLLEMLNVPVSQLKQVYDDHRECPSLLLQSLHGLFLEDSPEKAKHSPKTKPTSLGDDKQEMGERMIDFGILPTKMVPDTKLESMESLEAVAEEKAESKSAKKNSGKPGTLSAADQKRSSSSKLLKNELNSMLQKPPSHMQLNKVNLGLSILYARQALGTILANWSMTGPRISAQLLNCEEHNLALVLDVLNRDSSNLKLFEQVVSKVMSCCSEDYLQSVADAASYFMEERKSDIAVRESPHHKHKKVKGQVCIPSASVILVTFAKCCSTSPESSLDIASSADMKKNHHHFSGPNDRWRDIELPGNTLYFTYQPAGSGASKWKFTVNSAASSSHGSFFTGFVILNHILSTPSYCRIIDSATLWRRLIVVACKQKGSQRLKVIQLLLYLLESHTKSGDSLSDGPTELNMDLRDLAPLWRLYKQMSDDHGPEQTSPLIRALTELFVVAENVAMQWNVGGDFMSSMIDPKILQSSILQGLKRVVALSTAIAYDTGFSTHSAAKSIS